MATFLEAAGLPLPGETALIASSVLEASDKMYFVSVFVSAFLGAVLGDNIGYAIGHYAGRALVVRYGGWLGIQDGHLALVEVYVARYGSLLIIAARYFPVVRQLGGLAAGTVGLAWPRFFVANATGGEGSADVLSRHDRT